MVITQENQFDYGYNPITEEYGVHKEMMMDFGILKLKKGQSETIVEATKEIAVLLLEGSVDIEWNGSKKTVTRSNCFDTGPYALHVSKNVKIKISSNSESELVIQRTSNNQDFAGKFYSPEDCQESLFGDGLMKGTAKRMVRVVFDYNNAAYSNMVLGEVITMPGKWSSYPPHHHPQPEIYYYRFTKPEGFGCSIIGEDVYKLSRNSTAVIPGGLVHPQVAAPGYGMYYCWMIRHFDDNPWTERIDDPKYEWLYNKDAVIWPDKE